MSPGLFYTHQYTTMEERTEMKDLKASEAAMQAEKIRGQIQAEARKKLKVNQMLMRLVEGKDYDVAIVTVKGLQSPLGMEAEQAKLITLIPDENLIVLPPTETVWVFDPDPLLDGQEPGKCQVQRYFSMDMIFSIEFYKKSLIVTPSAAALSLVKR